MESETIAAIATPQGQGGIGIIRISGEDALKVAGKIFRAKRGVKPEEMRPYTAAYGVIQDGEKLIDEAIALVFHKPKSYTGEDVVELSAHGGKYVTRRILRAAIRAGARLAQPGEFTKRAFLNGRIDLTQAEAVMAIIGAKSEAAETAAQAQREGAALGRINEIGAEITEICSDLTAYLDFPEEDIPQLETPVLKNRIAGVKKRLRDYMETYGRGKMMRDGIETVIAGKPNVGKSTLMNRIVGEDRSIVTEIPGTTRDIVEETVDFAGIPMRLSDTAGIRETGDLIEREGVKRAEKKLQASQLVIAVFDGSRSIDSDDLKLIGLLKNKKAVAVVNKCDLAGKFDWREQIKDLPVVHLSASTGEGMETLAEAVKALVGSNETGENEGIAANERQYDCAKRALEETEAAEKALCDGITLDAVSVCMERASDALDELTGKKASEEIIDRVFSKFCVGK